MQTVKAPNLKLLKKEHENKWVAFAINYKKLIAVGESLAELIKKVGKNQAVITHVLPADVGYAPTVR